MIVVISLTLSIVPFLFLMKFFTSIKTEAVILAFSPGGVNEMGLLAALISICFDASFTRTVLILLMQKNTYIQNLKIEKVVDLIIHC